MAVRHASSNDCWCLVRWQEYAAWGNYSFPKAALNRTQPSHQRSYTIRGCPPLHWVSCKEWFSTASGLNSCSIFDILCVGQGFIIAAAVIYYTCRFSSFLFFLIVMLYFFQCYFLVWGGLGAHKYCFWDIRKHQGCNWPWGNPDFCQTFKFSSWRCQGTGRFYCYFMGFIFLSSNVKGTS